MGDRTQCILTIGGWIDVDQVDRLAENLDDFGVSFHSFCYDKGDEIEIETARDALLAGCAMFEVEEVNYGQIDDDLGVTLAEIGASYTWEWGAGGGYGPGVTFYDAATAQSKSFCYVDGAIMLSLEDLEKDPAATIAEAKRWSGFADKLTLQIAATSHDRAERIKALLGEPKAFLAADGAAGGDAGDPSGAKIRPSQDARHPDGSALTA